MDHDIRPMGSDAPWPWLSGIRIGQNRVREPVRESSARQGFETSCRTAAREFARQLPAGGRLRCNGTENGKRLDGDGTTNNRQESKSRHEENLRFLRCTRRPSAGVPGSRPSARRGDCRERYRARLRGRGSRHDGRRGRCRPRRPRPRRRCDSAGPLPARVSPSGSHRASRGGRDARTEIPHGGALRRVHLSPGRHRDHGRAVRDVDVVPARHPRQAVGAPQRRRVL